MSYTELYLHPNEACAYFDGDLEPRRRRRKRPELPRPEPSTRTPEEVERETRESLAWIESWGNELEVDELTKRRLQAEDVGADRFYQDLED